MPQDLIFAVGDVHGRLDLAQAAVDQIHRRAGGDRFRVVFLGDYVDRGPESRGVVELMMTLCEDPRITCLKGNHEAMMIRALSDVREDDFQGWLSAGGDATIAAYGAEDRADTIAAVPADHLRWMEALPLTSGDGFRIYVHAGLAPSTPFARQTPETCLWIRERFLRAPAHQFDSHIVHGHTPYWAGKPDPGEPELLDHRTNLDLGAFMTDRLGVGVFDADAPGGPIEVLVVSQTPGEAASVISLDPRARRRELETAAARPRAWFRNRPR